jgi:2-(1,2-epoxy-1,2-dihydrophenyl)acetyl-CoA isomerase
MEFTTLTYEVSGAVATVRLNRPEVLNALDRQLMNELNNVFDEMAMEARVRAIVLTGTGRGFCSGADLRSLTTEPDIASPAVFKGYLRRINELILRMLRLEKPVVAAVNGPAVGAGCNIALASDIIYMAHEAYFSEIFVKRGLVPDFGGLYLLPRYIGLARAKEFIFTGEKIDSRLAAELGIANRVLPPEELVPEAIKLAERLASGPTVAIGLAKVGILRGLESGLDAVLEYEALAQALIRTTSDATEAITAFLDKREPNFQGR